MRDIPGRRVNALLNWQGTPIRPIHGEPDTNDGCGLSMRRFVAAGEGGDPGRMGLGHLTHAGLLRGVGRVEHYPRPAA